METLSEAIDRLRSSGYRDSFRPDAGCLRALAASRLYAPEELVVDEVVRFEGPTDPGDEAILFALRSDDGAVRGTYAAAYGSGVDPANAELVHRLPSPRSGRRGHARGALG
jgi:hypothetical protein